MSNASFSNVFVLNGDTQFSNWTWYVSMLGYIFGHASLDQLLGNISLLLILGPIIELKFGTQRFVWMTIITALVTGIIHTLLWDNSLFGFSGIAFMYIVLSTLLNIRNREIPFTFILVLALYFTYFCMESLATLDTKVSHFAHLFGGAMGAFWGFNKGKL